MGLISRVSSRTYRDSAMSFVRWLTFAIVFIRAVQATNVKGHVDFKALVPGQRLRRTNLDDTETAFEHILRTAVVYLEGEPGTSQHTTLYPDGSFEFLNIARPNSYILMTKSPTFEFKPIRIDVNAKGSIRVRELNRIDPSHIELLSYPITVQILGARRPFHKRQEISIGGLVAMMTHNPMILFGGLSVIFMAFMKSIPQEEWEQIRQERQQLKRQKEEIAGIKKSKTRVDDDLTLEEELRNIDIAEQMRLFFAPNRPPPKKPSRRQSRNLY